MLNTVEELILNPKLALTITLSTAGVSAASSPWLGWIPNDIGKLGTLVGLVVSLGIFIFHLVKYFHESKLRKLELREKEIDLAIKQKELARLSVDEQDQ